MSIRKEHLKAVIVDQQEMISAQLKMTPPIPRDGLEWARAFLNHPNILLISGLRRAGKSTFAQLLTHDTLCPRINFDDERLIGFDAQDFSVLLECFHELYPHFTFILLDEIQNIDGWELFVNRLRQQYRCIVTGSNAHLLSSELATHLTGRFIPITLFPLSFKEFLTFKGIALDTRSLYSTKTKSALSALFSTYLVQGGIFDHYKFGAEFLRSLFSSIITKDIISRYRVKYPAVLEELAITLINYFTSKLSLHKLTASLDIKSSHTTKDYIRYLENTFLIFTLPKFSYKLKEQLSSFKKVYVIDNGLVTALTSTFSENRGRFLENAVAVELKRRSVLENTELFYWDNYARECDFVVKKGKDVVAAYQVTTDLTMQNQDREIKGLLTALETFHLKEGVIITESSEDLLDRDGFTIRVVPAWKWMLEI